MPSDPSPLADQLAAAHRPIHALRNLYHASTIVRDRRQHARHVVGRFLEAATGRDLEITLNVPGDLRESPFVASTLRARGDHLQLRLCSSAALLYRHVNVLRQVCDDYFRHPECVPQAGELVIDAGANIGCYSMVAAMLEPTMRSHAFEPLACAYAKLTMNCRINDLAGRIVTNQTALGSKPGEFELEHTLRGHQGTLTDDLADGDYGSEAVSVVQLDRYIADSELRAPGIMKLDVEGFEVEVLAGAENALRTVRLLVTEWHSSERLDGVTRAATKAGLDLLSSCSDDLGEPIGIAYFRRPTPTASGITHPDKKPR